MEENKALNKGITLIACSQGVQWGPHRPQKVKGRLSDMTLEETKP